jgi:hypothetical protein
LLSGWYAATNFVKGKERVSSGTEDAVDGSTMKQSSISGSTAPSINVLFAVSPGNGDVLTVVGMPSSTGR